MESPRTLYKTFLLAYKKHNSTERVTSQSKWMTRCCQQLKRLLSL